MTSPEWLAADEDDADRFPAPHASAQISTHGPDEGSRVVPDPARVALEDPRAIMRRHGFGRKRAYLTVSVNLDPVPGWGNTVEDYRVLTQRLLDDAIGHYEPVVAVADEERAALVAEVERLRRERQHAIDVANRTYTQAVAAEAKVAKVEALLALREASDIRDEDGFAVVRVDDVRAMIDPGPDHSCESNGQGACRHCGADEPPPWPTRAVLADAPAEQRAEAPPNIGDTCCGQCPGDTCYVDGVTGERAEGGA